MFSLSRSFSLPRVIVFSILRMRTPTLFSISEPRTPPHTHTHNHTMTYQQTNTTTTRRVCSFHPFNIDVRGRGRKYVRSRPHDAITDHYQSGLYGGKDFGRDFVRKHQYVYLYFLLLLLCVVAVQRSKGNDCGLERTNERTIFTHPLYCFCFFVCFSLYDTTILRHHPTHTQHKTIHQSSISKQQQWIVPLKVCRRVIICGRRNISFPF
jgi:hypothetical protein